jgi:WD40 repeat protein
MRIKHADAVKKVAFSHDSKRLLTVSGSSVRIWDPGNGQLKDRLTFRHPVERAVFSPDGKKAAVLTLDASHTNRIRVMDIAAHSAVWSYEEFADEIAYHPSGNYLAIASALGQAKILDPTRPEDEAEVLAVSHYRPRGYKWINSVSFSPDGRWLATGSADRTARIWDVTNGAELLSILHRRQVATAVFSPDGRWLATSSHDETTRIWDAADGTELLRITGTGGTDEIDFTPDSSVIAVNGIGIRLYRIAG